MAEPMGFVAPQTIQEACAMISSDPGARAVAGGTALAILMRQGLARPRLLVGLTTIPPMRRIEADDALYLGAGITLRTAEQFRPLRERWPVLAETFRHVATPRIRNMATIGGGLAHADPNQDPPAAYAALGARVHIAGVHDDRWVSASDFFIDYYESALREGEIVIGIEIPALPPMTGAAFLKFLPRSVDDYATVAAAAVVRLDEAGRCRSARVAMGAVGATPVLVDLTGALAGREVGGTTARQAAEQVRDLIEPNDDVRGSAGYKRDMAVVFAGRALVLAAARAAGTVADQDHG